MNTKEKQDLAAQLGDQIVSLQKQILGLQKIKAALEKEDAPPTPPSTKPAARTFPSSRRTLGQIKQEHEDAQRAKANKGW